MQTIRVTLHSLPAAFQPWPMLESKHRGKGSGCHLCTMLRKHAVVSEKEFQTITTAITPFAFCFHHKELMAYFEFAPEVLEALEKDSYNWANLRPFADSMLAKVAAKDLESAYTEWMQTLWKLNERTGLSMEDLEVLDVALANPLASC